MKFLLILTHVEKAWDRVPPGEPERVYQCYMEVERELKAKDKFVDSQRLRPSGEARTIRNLSDDKRVVVDGPFTGGEEVMGGYYVLECDSIDEAVEWARVCPTTAMDL